MTATRFSTTLRDHARKTIERLRYADIVVGIPSYHSGSSIVHVIQTIAEGLERHYPDAKAVIMVSDGGSTDDTREIANLVQIHSYHIEKIVTIYRGVPGKGSGLRTVFEVANFLKAKAVAVFDSDLVSITPEWVRNFLDPVFKGYDFVAPYYRRYKLDGTITNTIAYNLTRALYGYRVRQPIGGDFGISQGLVKYYFDQDVWETDVARFGIDIWMTTTAIVGGFKICQARLGVKVHGEKDPAADLGPMFRQVVGDDLPAYGNRTRSTGRRSRDPGASRSWGGGRSRSRPPSTSIRTVLLIISGWGTTTSAGVWEHVIEERDLEVVRTLAAQPRKEDDFFFPLRRGFASSTVYAHFPRTPRQRFKVLDTLVPLYNARVASLINEVRDMISRVRNAISRSMPEAFEQMKIT